MITAKMRAQSRQLVCAGCSGQIKGKVRKQRCENCYRSRLKGSSATRHPKQRVRWASWNHPGEAALSLTEREPDGCWLYTGLLDDEGYGKSIKVGAHPSVLPHRAAYLFAVGPIPSGMQLDHTCHSADPSCLGGPECRHRRCVNPAHLEPVTPRMNNERSRGVTAVNGRKTHCIHGHEFSPENTRLRTNPDGSTSRQCRECARQQRRRSRQRARHS